METQTKMEVTPPEEDDTKTRLEKKLKKLNFLTKHDPKVRMSYIVPEEIYPENIDL